MKALISFFTCLLLLISIHSIGQEKSKARSYSKVNNGNDYLEEAIQLESENPAKSIELLQKSLETAIANKDYKLEGESYYLLGKINNSSKQYDLAINYFNKAKAAYIKETSSDGIYKTTKALAEALTNNKNYDLALNEYTTFLELAKKESNVEDEISTYQARATIYRLQGKFDEALLELDKAENNGVLGNQNNSIVSKLKIQRGEVFEAQNKDEEALNQYVESAVIAESMNDKRAVLNSNLKQSKLLNRRGRKVEAVKKQKESLKLLKSTEEEQDQVSEFIKEDEGLMLEPNLDLEETKANIDIAKNYIELDSNEQAIDHLRAAINISSNSGAIVEKKEAYAYLSEAYYNTGNFDSSLVNYRNYVGLVDTLYKLKEDDIQASFNLNKELSSRLQRINSLEKDHELQEKTIELLESQRLVEEKSNRQLRIIVYSLIIGVILLLLLVYFMSKNAKQKKVANQLLALKTLRTQMNPHFIFNALNSVNNFISQNDERSANKYLSDFSRLMRLVLENSEHDFISLNNEIEILKLYVSLEHSRFSEKFDYELNIDPNLEIDRYEIPPMMVQPYIENAVWHGLRYLESKGHLRIELKEEESTLIIRVEDNGIGREKSQLMKTKNQKKSKSTAMKNIAERLEIINEIHQSEVQVIVSDLNEDKSGTLVEIRVKAQS